MHSTLTVDLVMAQVLDVWHNITIGLPASQTADNLSISAHRGRAAEIYDIDIDDLYVDLQMPQLVNLSV